MRLIPVVAVLALISGCLCYSGIPGGGQTTTTQDEYPDITHPPRTYPTSTVAAPTTSTTVEAATTSTIPVTSTTSTMQAASTTLTSTPTSTTDSSTSSTTLKASSTTLNSFDLDDLAVQVAACDDDYYGDAMVGGYVTNPTPYVVRNVILVTELQDTENDVIEGGEKTLLIDELPADSALKFRVIYEKPPAWVYCRAYVRT